MKKLNLKYNHTFILVSILCSAMGILEAIVVVYLRQLYYPNGFDFPLTFLTPKMIGIEWAREFSTIIMLVSIGIIAGKNHLQRFLYFLFSFAVWDLTYYGGLKLFLNWPSSLLTWDILFLIPVPWISPVLAPIICSNTMIIFAISIIYLLEKGHIIKMKITHWSGLLMGAFIIFISFVWDYFKIIFENKLLSDFWDLTNNEQSLKLISQYIPSNYNWWLFWLGEIIILSTIIQLIRTKKQPKL